MEEKEMLEGKIKKLELFVRRLGDVDMLQPDFERGWDYGYRKGIKLALDVLNGKFTIL